MRGPWRKPIIRVLAAFGAVLWMSGCGGGGGVVLAGLPAPTGVVIAIGNGQLTLTWNAVTGATTYHIYWRTTPGVTKQNGTKLSNVASPYVHAGLTNGTPYYYVVTAANANGESAVSQEVSGTPAAVPQPPAAPANVQAAAGDGQVTVSWDPSAGATSYNLYMASATGVTKANYASQPDGMRHANATSPYIHTTLSNGKTYYFVATAVNAAGESAESSEVSATPNTLPSQFTLTIQVAGGGTVSSAPVGIFCPDDCLEPYNSGTAVTLEALPALGMQFSAWSGDPDCADGLVTMSADKTCTASFADLPPPTGPSSFGLIDAALSSGALDAETALVYKVYASFGDPRLPATYKGDDSRVLDTGIIEVVRQQFQSLSAPTQALLVPFLKTPDEPDSWVALGLGGEGGGSPLRLSEIRPSQSPPIAWNTVASANGKVKVWWQQRRPLDEPKARAIAGAMDSPIWPDLTGLMAREPLPDNGSGGDNRLDIYLVRIGDYGQAVSLPPHCKKMPAYMLVDARKGGLFQTVAHEFMHAIQFSYGVANGCVVPGEYQWWAEASATWAEDYVYRSKNSEQPYAWAFLNDPKMPLEDTTEQLHPYGAYLWPFFLARSSSIPNPEVVKAIWDNTETSGALDAHNAAISFGFEHQWPLFVLYNWNLEPVDYYKQWDGLIEHAMVTGGEDATLGGSEYDEIRSASKVRHLSAQYYRYPFPAGTDVRTAAFFNGLTWKLSKENIGSASPNDFYTYVGREVPENQRKGGRVQALFKIGGQWQPPEDWTYIPVMWFCLDRTSTRIEELVVIYSNSEYDTASPTYELTPQDEAPLLYISNMACLRWEGWSEIVNIFDGVTMTVRADNITWENPVEMYLPVLEYLLLPGGTVTWTVSGTDSEGCIWSGSATAPVDMSNGWLRTYNFTYSGTLYRAYQGGGANYDTVTMTADCPGPPPETRTVQTIIGAWLASPAPAFPYDKVSGSGTVINYSVDTGTWKERFHFEARRQ